MTKPRSVGIIVGGLCILAASVAHSEDVPAAQFFGPGSALDKWIVLAPGQVLVLGTATSATTEYILNGRDLIVEAPEVRVTGKVVIRAFKTDSRGENRGVKGTAKAGRDGAPGNHDGTHKDCESSGCPGIKGDTGETGEQGGTGGGAGRVWLNIGKLSGTGSLNIANDGQRGGTGGTGGKGGKGGTGGKGVDRDSDCTNRNGGPGDGGRGGQAGKGGTAGQGGQGGSGGDVLYAPTLTKYLNKRFLVTAVGGPGGDAGVPGQPGAVGNGNNGGSGSRCGGSGTAAADGEPNTIGDPAPASIPGAHGRISISSFQQ
jgi:hypothetical protein